MPKKRKSKKGAYESYCIRIESWELPYSFGINRLKDFWPGPYQEHFDLEIAGMFLYPSKLSGKNIRVNIWGERELTDALERHDKYPDLEPKCIGSISARGKHRDFMGSVSADTLPLVSQMLTLGKYKYLSLHGFASIMAVLEFIRLNFRNLLTPMTGTLILHCLYNPKIGGIDTYMDTKEKRD